MRSLARRRYLSQRRRAPALGRSCDPGPLRLLGCSAATGSRQAVARLRGASSSCRCRTELPQAAQLPRGTREHPRLARRGRCVPVCLECATAGRTARHTTRASVSGRATPAPSRSAYHLRRAVHPPAERVLQVRLSHAACEKMVEARCVTITGGGTPSPTRRWGHAPRLRWGKAEAAMNGDSLDSLLLRWLSFALPGVAR